jgi:hypothetical protein
VENQVIENLFHADEFLTGSAVSLFTGYFTNVIMFGPGLISPIHIKDY